MTAAVEKEKSRKRPYTESSPLPLPPDHEFLQKFHQEYLIKKQQRRVNQRKAANARERKRVGRINTAFNQLEAKLQESNITSSKDQCLSKIKTLRSAIQYIDALTRLLQDSDASSLPSSPTTSSDHSDCMYESTTASQSRPPVPPPPPPPLPSLKPDLTSYDIWPEFIDTFIGEDLNLSKRDTPVYRHVSALGDNCLPGNSMQCGSGCGGGTPLGAYYDSPPPPSIYNPFDSVEKIYGMGRRF